MTDHFFLDESHNIVTGDSARQVLQTTNDAQFLSADKGIVRVTRERWQTAQTFESNFWHQCNPDTSDDRNHEHLAHFDQFSVIKGHRFQHAIELGCGPFTNLRLIAQECTIRSCTLLDPLIESYLAHKHCSYRSRRYLLTETNALSRFLGKTLPLRAVRRLIRNTLPGMLRQHVPIQRMIASPIEEMPETVSYDLIVIINVIEHCFDIDAVFNKIRAVAKPDAILVFSDRYYDHDVVAHWVTGTRYDAGHPLLVDRKVIDTFLENNFETLYRDTSWHEWVVEGFDFSHDALYFIGRLKN